MTGSISEIIKEKLDIVDFLRGYLSLHPAGKNFKALCPFHREKTPSFMVSRERQSWHCFGCNLGGDIFSFLMRYENIDFGEALKILAEKAGVELKRLSPQDYKFFGLLYDLNNLAKEFFKRELENYSPAMDYLEKRGLKKETIEDFEIGFAPNGAEALNLHLINLGFSPEDVVRAGLAVKTDRGVQIDRFRGRIMFPIHNHFGKVVGFTGRILPQFETGETGKYINSPETPIFNKSKLLYGFWKSKNFIRESQSVFIVEGQMDFLMSWQAGFRNTIATSGTALTLDHLRAIRRLTDSIVLSFDNDEAGIRAGERVIDLVEANDMSVKVAIFSDFKDPADAVQADPSNLRRVIDEAKPAIQFYFERYLPEEPEKFDESSLGRLRIVLSKIKNISSPVERHIWIKRLADRLKIGEKFLVEEMEKVEIKEGDVQKIEESGGGLPSQKENFSRRELISQELLGVALSKSDFDFLLDCVPYLPLKYQEIFGILKSGEKRSTDKNVDDLINLIVLKSGAAVYDNVEELKNQLAAEYWKEKRRELVSKIKKAEASNDEIGLREALEELGRTPAF